MIAVIQITPWHWAGFILCILFFLALDLGVFHRGAHVVKFKEALAWTALWFALAMLFAGVAGAWARAGRGGPIHHRLCHRTVALARQRPGHRAHLCLVPRAAGISTSPALSGHPRRARHARRDDCRRRGAHPRIRLGALCFRRVPGFCRRQNALCRGKNGATGK